MLQNRIKKFNIVLNPSMFGYLKLANCNALTEYPFDVDDKYPPLLGQLII